MPEWSRVVVGVDGSDGSLKALLWAAEIAKERRAELRVVMALRPSMPPLLAAAAPSYSTREDVDPQGQAEQRLIESIHQVLGEEPQVLVQPEIRTESAAKALIEASKSAELLVVGSRGMGGFAGLLLGSVSQHVSAHAHCSVVVVR